MVGQTGGVVFGFHRRLFRHCHFGGNGSGFREMRRINLDLEIIAMTDDGVRLSDGMHAGWVAKCRIDNYDHDWEPGPQTVDVDIPEWIAEKVGWV